MIEVKDLLVKFNKILNSGQIKVEAISGVLYKVVGIKIKKEDIKIKNNIIYLNIKPIYKNEIFLKKEEIQHLLLESLGKRAPTNFQ